MLNLSLEKIELLKKRIHIYKEKVRIASNYTMDIKRKTNRKNTQPINLKKEKRILDNSFISEKTNY